MSAHYIKIEGVKDTQVSKTREICDHPFVLMDYNKDGELLGVEVITNGVSSNLSEPVTFKDLTLAEKIKCARIAKDKMLRDKGLPTSSERRENLKRSLAGLKETAIRIGQIWAK